MTESLVVERSKTGLISKVVLVIGVLVTSYEIVIVMGLNFALYTILRNIGIELRFLLDTLDIQQSMAFVLGLVMAVAFLIYPAYKKVLSLRIPIYDYVLASIAFLSMFYLVLVYPSVVRAGYVEATLANILIPTVAIILLLETSRRALGIA